MVSVAGVSPAVVVSMGPCQSWPNDQLTVPIRRTSPPTTSPGGANAASFRVSPARGIESSERLGRHRWKTARSIAWLFGYRRLTVRYERKGSQFLAFPGLAAALTCYKKLAKRTT